MESRRYTRFEFLEEKTNKTTNEEDVVIMVDDTSDIGKEPMPFKDENEKELHYNLLKKYKKEFKIEP